MKRRSTRTITVLSQASLVTTPWRTRFGMLTPSLGLRDRRAAPLAENGLDAAHPEFRRALAAPHANLGRFGRYRDVGEDADPDAADALDVARDRAPRRLDLARRDAARVDRLEAEGAKIERRAALGHAMNAALMRLAVFAAFRSKHVSATYSRSRSRRPPRSGG